MDTKTVLAKAFIALILFSALIGVQFVKVAEANFTPLPELPLPIYIRNDGSIEPSSAPIERVGEIYKLTGNIEDTIEIERDNIVLDGNHYNLTKPPVNTSQLMTPIGWLPSIHLLGRSNVTIKNVVFNRCYTGITAKNSSNIAVTHNTFNFNAADGIVFWNCRNSIIMGNSMFGNGVAMDFLPNNDHVDIKFNNITGGWSHAIWGSATNSKIIGNNIVGNEGVALYYVGSYNLITQNNFENNSYGMLGNRANNVIHHNNFINNRDCQFHGGEPNTFDDGEEGNHWSDYNGRDANGDGIGDTPYIIDENHKDHYPLMQPLELAEYENYDKIPEFPRWTQILLVLAVFTVAVTVYKQRLIKLRNKKSIICKH